MSIKQKIKLGNIASKILTLSAIVLTVFSIFSLNINVNAQLGIEPFGINKSDPKETGWFKYTVDPGAKIEDFAVISNLGTEDAQVNLRSNDAVITEDGAFTIVSNSVENKEVGKWVGLKENTLTIPAGKGVKVPFTIQVPNDAKPGEYAGGLSITEIDNGDGSGAPLAIKTRIGNRIYLTVKGDINVSSSVKDLSVINPNLDNFPDELRKRGFIKPENLVFKFTAENTGDAYSIVKGSYKLTTPDGKELNQTFSRGLAPRSGPRTFYIETKAQYQVGKTSLNLSYSTAVQNEPKDPTGIKYVYTNDKGSLDTSFDLTVEQLNKFKEMVAKPEDIKPTGNKSGNTANQPLISGSAPVAQNPAPQVITKEVPADNSMMVYMGIGLGLLLLILIALVGYKLLKDKKSKPSKS